MKKHTLATAFILILFGLSLFSCRKEISQEPEDFQPSGSESEVLGMYILNEGTFGSSNASLDYYDFGEQKIHQDIFNKVNPEIVKGLGDVGNDIGIYGSKMYLVINNSNKVEVVDAHTVKSIKTIDIEAGRHIAFHGGKAFITSTEGYVSVVDTATLEVEKEIRVGRNPEGLAVVGEKLYVANSGGFSFPDYDSTLSVIDLRTLEEVKKIPVAINLEYVIPTDGKELYVTSLGDFIDLPSGLYVIDTETDRVEKAFDFGVAKMTIRRDSAFAFQYDFIEDKSYYPFINTQTKEVISLTFLKEAERQSIHIPYGIIARPDNGDLFITDAKDYSAPGTLYCIDPQGNKKWEVTTGVLPGSFAFLTQ